MVAVGTLELQMLDPPITIDFSECWQGSYYIENDVPTNVLDIDCGIFLVDLELPSTPPEPGDTEAVQWRILWVNEKTQDLKFKETCENPAYLSPYLIGPHSVMVSSHNGQAPYEYHVETYPGNEYCAIYNLKIKVLSEPYGDLDETPISKRHREGNL